MEFLVWTLFWISPVEVWCGAITLRAKNKKKTTHTVNTIDEGIVATVAHSKPVKNEEQNVYELPATKKYLLTI